MATKHLLALEGPYTTACGLYTYYDDLDGPDTTPEITEVTCPACLKIHDRYCDTVYEAG